MIWRKKSRLRRPRLCCLPDDWLSPEELGLVIESPENVGGPSQSQPDPQVLQTFRIDVHCLDRSQECDPDAQGAQHPCMGWAREECLQEGAQSRNVVVEAHAPNDEVEEAWKAICAQAGMHVAQLEREAGVPPDKVNFNAGPPVYNWATGHAAFIRNRFPVGQGLMPYENVTGTSYTSKLACFGERVRGYVHTTAKEGHGWLADVWLAKTIMNDVHVVGLSKGQNVHE